MARSNPTPVVAGDLTDHLHDVAAKAPRDATLVIFHSAVLAYLEHPERTAFLSAVDRLRCHWLSNEHADAVPEIAASNGRRPAPSTAAFTLALNGHPLAYTGPHGQSIRWLGRELPAALAAGHA